MTANAYRAFHSRFPEDLDAPFLVSDRVRFTYRDLDAGSARLATRFKADGLVPGDRVTVLLEKSAETLFAYFACLRAGFVYTPLNPSYTEREIEYFFRDSDPAIVLCDPAREKAVAAAVAAAGTSARIYTLDQNGRGSLMPAAADCSDQFDPVSAAPADLAVIIYTSGTTGNPKGAMISHDNLISNARILNEAWGFQPDDVMLHALPIFHVHGLFLGIHLPLLSGAVIRFLDAFQADSVLEHLPSATVFMGVPTFYNRLLASPALTREASRNIRLFTSGSAPLLTQTFDEFHARTGHRILERYGMSETGMNTSNPLEGERKPGTVGPPLPGVEARIVDDDGQPVPAGETGSLQVKGANVFTGYWQLPGKTAEEFTPDGFFRTGDLARMDDDGYVAIVGRSKDLVISGGLNVYPKEVETVIDGIDGVLESAVIGIADADFGEAVTAVVVKDGSAEVTEASIIAYLKEQLVNYKVAKRVHFVEELPRNTMGKVQKNALREQFDPGTE